MALKKRIKEIRVGSSCAVRIYRISEWNEYLVRTLVDGKFVGGKDSGYHTDDKQDARSTAAAQVKWLRKKKACR